MKKLSLSKGFTLVELLVVIAIIGILATLLLLQLNVARSKARDIKRVGDVNQLRTAVELYYDAFGFYPQAIGDTEVGPYMANGRAPLDPSSNAAYGYRKDADPATKFQISANLENKNANALGADADINEAWSIDGTVENCTSITTCIFDLGVK